MLHTLDVISCAPESLRVLTQACREAADEGREVRLDQQPSMLLHSRGWDLSDRQQDASEFLQHFLERAGVLNTLWDRRSLTETGPRLLDQGTLPIHLGIPDTDSTLQQAVVAWHRRGQYNAISFTDGVVVLHLGRFLRGHKLFTEVSISSVVLLPVFAEGINCRWEAFEVLAAQVHLGNTPHSGHYRTLLRAGDSWWLSDDASLAVPAPLEPAHLQNAYLIWAARAQN